MLESSFTNMNNNQLSLPVSSKEVTDFLVKYLTLWEPEHADLILVINKLSWKFCKSHFPLSHESSIECAGYFNQAVDCIENDHESYLESISQHDGVIEY